MTNPLTKFLEERADQPAPGRTESTPKASTGRAIGTVALAILLGVIIAAAVFLSASGLIALAVSGILAALAGEPVSAWLLGMQLTAGVAGIALIWRVVATRRKQTLSLDLKGLL